MQTSEDSSEAEILPKLGLVVQGPMRSEGRTGKSLQPGGFKNHTSTFDCYTNVVRLVRDARNAGYQDIVLSTWESERGMVLGEVGCDVIYSVPPVERTRFRPTKHGNLPVNDLKQLYSTIQGLNRLKTLGVTHAVKVRTDQWVDLGEIARLHSLFNSRIVFPEKVKYRHDYINDFYFAGPISDLLLFCQASAEFVQVKSNIHNNLFYAYAQRKLLHFRFPISFLRKRSNPEHKETRLERHMWNCHFGVFPQTILSGLVWRGYPVA